MNIKILALAAFAAALGTGSQLNALDTITPGLQCRYYNPLGGDTYFDPGGLSANGLKNVSSSNQYVSCPITKGFDMHTRGAWIVLDDSSTDCKLYYRGPNGVNQNIPEHRVTAAGSWYLHEWDFESGWATGGRSIAIYCRIDAGKSINHYFHQEW